MTRTKSEELALLVLRLTASRETTLMEEARELAVEVLGDHVVQDIVTCTVENRSQAPRTTPVVCEHCEGAISHD